MDHRTPTTWNPWMLPELFVATKEIILYPRSASPYLSDEDLPENDKIKCNGRATEFFPEESYCVPLNKLCLLHGRLLIPKFPYFTCSACINSPPPTKNERSKKKKFVKRSSAADCQFCKKNGEPECTYRNHKLRDATGRVTCPALRKFSCPRCGDTGDAAHTIKYCPITPVQAAEIHNQTLMSIPSSAEDSVPRKIVGCFRY